jgi:hypothetical protein
MYANLGTKMTADHTVDHGADHGHGDHVPGTMDISQHKKSWENFIVFVKWSMGAVLLIVLFLAIFRTSH